MQSAMKYLLLLHVALPDGVQAYSHECMNEWVVVSHADSLKEAEVRRYITSQRGSRF